jgi:tRNA U38,U39,U40 pseudouridine synthase TruA
MDSSICQKFPKGHIRLPLYSYIIFVIIASNFVGGVHGLVVCDAGSRISRKTGIHKNQQGHMVRDHQSYVLMRPKKNGFFTSTTLSSTSPSTTTKSIAHECKFCAETFSSRNSLFRHIDLCSQRPQEDALAKESAATTSLKHKLTDSRRHTLGFRFAYVCNSPNSTEPEAQIAGREIQETLRRAMGFRQEIKILSSTQASVANQRHRSLTQEVGCAAANDIMTISFSSFIERKKILLGLLDEMNSILQDEITAINIRILEISYLNSSTFHAENSCTQYIYHYLLPLKWLQDGEQIEQWWLLSESENNIKEADNGKRTTTSSEMKKQHPGTFRSQPPSASLKMLRSALKSAESISLPNRRVRRRLLQGNNVTRDRKIERVATRRMGTISNKERRAWHNFADPKLQGDASPNQEPVWRVVDRSRIAGITKNPINDEVVAVLEFRGDAFLPQQIRRVVGTAVGITNGLLPQNTFDIATRPDTAIVTALAPSRRLYLRDVRFHFDESNEGFCKDDNHDKEDSRGVSRKSTNWLQQKIFLKSSKKGTIDIENKWLRDLEETIAPQVRNQIRLIDECYEGDEVCELLDPAPDVYSKVLALLRELTISGWPETSIARSRVIKNDKGKLESDSENGGNNFGSFTIVNPELFRPTPTQNVPLGNELFPELVQSVFELEPLIAETNKARKPSTHCAVNFNASFTPHVDSGTGLGQSLSMIVGLGEYNGGELLVEGDSYPIRYKPLEFDGWKQRHWTGVYTGERFSFVWFTPEHKDKK